MVFHEQPSIGLAEIKQHFEQGACRYGRRPRLVDHTHQQGPQEAVRSAGPADRRGNRQRGAVPFLV